MDRRRSYAEPGFARRERYEACESDCEEGGGVTGEPWVPPCRIPSSSIRVKNAFANGELSVRSRTSSQWICSRRVRATSSTEP